MKSRVMNVLGILGFLFVAGCLVGATAQPLAAQVTIPQGSTVTAAVFSVYVVAPPYPTNQTVNLHRITEEWTELGITWANFADHYDSAVVGSFYTDHIGWQTVDLTLLVQNWVDNIYPNYGVVLMQGMTPYNVYYSSEAANPELRPKLDIWYTTPTGESRYVKIQRPDVAQDGVADAYITQLYPYSNDGAGPTFLTGNVNGYEKYSVVRFFFSVLPSSPGTGTPGYWMNHPEAWPVPGISIGGNFFSMEDAIMLMKAPVSTDKTFTMFAALVAAKLNVLIGNDASCIAATIEAADAWMATYPVGSGVEAGGKDSPWRVGEPLYLLLDAYNNGLLCAPARD